MSTNTHSFRVHFSDDIPAVLGGFNHFFADGYLVIEYYNPSGNAACVYYKDARITKIKVQVIEP